jgi:hypothetical protein
MPNPDSSDILERAVDWVYRCKPAINVPPRLMQAEEIIPTLIAELTKAREVVAISLRSYESALDTIAALEAAQDNNLAMAADLRAAIAAKDEEITRGEREFNDVCDAALSSKPRDGNRGEG